MTAIRIRDSRDTRTPEQLGALRAAEQDAADRALEREWQARVQANIRRRERARTHFTQRTA